ncbi:neuronal acetylcholine receptor subunit alpha-3-like [Ylistrum balloti]|uniref:neuronal acetylcholine receptor subunit alpha-3-like n=1 Tax=Ylistrum balloti TaxID=509963 RepID=UPI0029059675|nr:neuronal acetylcholine receptor subunit alpha-3-like [Ylistrum balloti]
MKSVRNSENLVVLLALMAVSIHLVAGATLDDMQRLQTQLFANYSNIPRPVYNQSETVQVGVQMYLMSIIQVDAVSSLIELSTGAMITWSDYRLAWDPNDYGGLTSYSVDPNTIWYPGLFITSTSDDLEQIGNNDFHVDILSNGTITWIVGKLIMSSCNVDMTSFPMDTQRCTVILMPWGYTASEVTVYPVSRSISMDFSSANGEWSIESTSVSEYDLFMPYYSSLAVQLTLKRKSTYFVISLILPMNLLGFLVPFVFLLPASSGERISYIITMFLSLAVYMTIVTSMIPQVSDPMAGITYYTFVSLAFSSGIVFLTIFTLRFEALDDVGQFPKFIVWTVKKLFMCCNKKRRRTQIEDGKTGRNEGEFDECETETKLTKAIMMKYIDMVLFIFTMAVPLIVNIFFIPLCW